MPKLIGQRPPQGSKLLDDNQYRVPGYTRVRWNQLTCCLAAGVLPAEVAVSLDTTDRGGPHSYAKRWWRWFVLDAALARVALDLPEGSQIAAVAETKAVAVHIHTFGSKWPALLVNHAAGYSPEDSATQ